MNAMPVSRQSGNMVSFTNRRLLLCMSNGLILSL